MPSVPSPAVLFSNTEFRIFAVLLFVLVIAPPVVEAVLPPKYERKTFNEEELSLKMAPPLSAVLFLKTEPINCAVAAVRYAAPPLLSAVLL